MGLLDLLVGKKKKKKRPPQKTQRQPSKEDEWSQKEKEWKAREKQWRLKEKRIKELQHRIGETENRRRKAQREIQELEERVRSERQAKEKREWLEKLDRWREEERELERNATRQKRSLALQAQSFQEARHSDYEDNEIDYLEDEIESYSEAENEALGWVEEEHPRRRPKKGSKKKAKAHAKPKRPKKQARPKPRPQPRYEEEYEDEYYEEEPQPARRPKPRQRADAGPAALTDYDDDDDLDDFGEVDDDDVEFEDDDEPTSKVGGSLGVLPELNFDNFVVGENNRFPFVAAQSVAKAPAKAYNPLFIWGDVGLGKTHLLHSIANYILTQDPGAKIVYVSSETFTNHLVEAVESQTLSEFRRMYREVDVLLIDDIQFIAGKEHTQEEFFHTFNELYNNRHQIVISSDRPPSEIQALEKRLRSRFEGGLITEVKPPGEDIRMAILREKIKVMDIYIPDEVIRYIAQNIKANVRELNGALNRVKAFAAMTGSAITLETAEKALEGILPRDQAATAQPEMQSIDRPQPQQPSDRPTKPPGDDMDMILQLEKETGLGSGEIMDDFEAETKKMEEELMAELKKQGIEFK